MSISNALLAEIKKQTWSLCSVEKGKLFRVGTNFSVVGRDGTISKVVMASKASKEPRVIVPLKGSLQLEATETDEFTFGFKYKSENGEVEQFFMRFHFFRHDPTVFRVSSNPFKDEDKCCECECCCDDVGGRYVLYSTYDDGDRGTGGPHAN